MNGRATVFCVKNSSMTLRSYSVLANSIAFGTFGSSGIVLQAALQKNGDLLVADPVRLLLLEARPRPVADAEHFAALDRKPDVGRAVVAVDDLEFGAEHGVVQARRQLGIDAGVAADDQLLVEQILGALLRRRVPGEGHADLVTRLPSQLSLARSNRTVAGVISGGQHAALDQRDERCRPWRRCCRFGWRRPGCRRPAGSAR